MSLSDSQLLLSQVMRVHVPLSCVEVVIAVII